MIRNKNRGFFFFFHFYRKHGSWSLHNYYVEFSINFLNVEEKTPCRCWMNFWFQDWGDPYEHNSWYLYIPSSSAHSFISLSRTISDRVRPPRKHPIGGLWKHPMAYRQIFDSVYGLWCPRSSHVLWSEQISQVSGQELASQSVNDENCMQVSNLFAVFDALTRVEFVS